MVNDEVVGVLDCQSDRVDHFDSETIDLLTLFSTQASIALQNARLYSLEQQRARQLQAINAIAQQTTAVLDLEDLLSRVCQADSGRLPRIACLAFPKGRSRSGACGPITELLLRCIPEGGRFAGDGGTLGEHPCR